MNVVLSSTLHSPLETLSVRRAGGGTPIPFLLKVLFNTFEAFFDERLCMVVIVFGSFAHINIFNPLNKKE